MPLHPYLPNLMTGNRHKHVDGSSTMLDSGHLQVHFCFKVLWAYWLRLERNSYDPIWCIFYHGPGSLHRYSQGQGPNFQEKDHKEENQGGYLVPPWHLPSQTPVDNLCPGTGKTKSGKQRLQHVKDLEEFVGEWQGTRVRSLGLGRQGCCIDRASMRPSTYVWYHSPKDFRISVCDNK